MAAETARPAARHQPWYKILYVQVLIAILLGVLVGRFYPDLGKQLKPLGDGFIALIKMMIAPVIFCTVVHGISSMGDLKRVGRVGLKALIYFEVVSTVALAIGLSSARSFSPAVASTSTRPRSIRIRSRPTSPRQRKRASSRICSRSFPTATSARSPAVTCCKSCWCPSCPGLPSHFWARPASRSPMPSIRRRRCSSASSA